jgi:hypothetical protein
MLRDGDSQAISITFGFQKGETLKIRCFWRILAKWSNRTISQYDIFYQATYMETM